jgi:hypothetical protein
MTVDADCTVSNVFLKEHEGSQAMRTSLRGGCLATRAAFGWGERIRTSYTARMRHAVHPEQYDRPERHGHSYRLTSRPLR